MSWPDNPSRRLFSVSASVLLAGAVSGCLRPLYGEASSGRSMSDELAAIEVPEIRDRLGHYLRTELIFQLDGSGESAVKRYRLAINPPATGLVAAIVDSATARADAATLNGTAPFTLVSIADGKTVFQATATASATYDRSAQRFATVRAARDAEIRVAKTLAEQIRTRIATALASR